MVALQISDGSELFLFPAPVNKFCMNLFFIAGQRDPKIKNITQKELAEATTLSLNTIKSLESGSGKLSTVIAVLRELGALDQIDNFIPEPSISPLQLARMQGRQRVRASGGRRKHRAEDDAEW